METISQAMKRIKENSSLQAYAQAKLKRAKAGGKYICPFCNSGGHGRANSDSGFHIDEAKKYFKCFVCDTGGDIFDLAAQVENLGTDKRAQLEAVANFAGLAIDTPAASSKQEAKSKPKLTRAFSLKEYHGREADYQTKAREVLEQSEEAQAYLSERGYTLEEARSLGIGYDSSKRALVLPFRGVDYHLLRDITGEGFYGDPSHKYDKPKGEQPLDNPAAMEGKAFFVVEGLLDAYALQLLGFQAVACCGTGYAQTLQSLQALIGNAPVAILALDDDKAGRIATTKAAAAWEGAKLPFLAFDWESCNHQLTDEHKPFKNIIEMQRYAFKDFDGARRIDAERLKAVLTRVYEEAEKLYDENQNSTLERVLEGFNVKKPLDVAEQIYFKRGLQQFIPTGFKCLDAALGGGLPQGLVTIGAISSIGKTTLALQIADQIAESGRSVLYVTIEQSSLELVSKSLSRIMRQDSEFDREVHPKPASEIMSAKSRETWREEDTQNLIDALNSYVNAIGKHLYILEAAKQPSVSDVEQAAKYLAATGKSAPVIIIDYLQLLAPQSDRDTDKQAIDKNVMSLRQLARELKTPVVVISSLNRGSYNGGVELDSFKESGAIEYSSDVLIGLQPAGMQAKKDATADEKKAKKAAEQTIRHHKAHSLREVELPILKNRNGGLPDEPVTLHFSAVYSWFYE